jgi:hypothetical protein
MLWDEVREKNAVEKGRENREREERSDPARGWKRVAWTNPTRERERGRETNARCV